LGHSLMEEKKAKRKLTAILSADVKGYSHLMQDDEEATVRTITAYREVMTNLIQGNDGRVVDAKGDNLLAEFPSVVDAVRCGVEIQKELKVRNNDLPENRRMEFRIGINLGDVIEEEETIYGDGVNIAARLEGLAEGGGICISRMAFDSVKNKLDVGYEYLGEHSVKNIAEPVRVYKVLMEPECAGKVFGEERPKPRQWRWAAIAIVFIIVVGALAIWNFYVRPDFEPASVEKMAFPLPEKPSIAVLPFANMSGDPGKDYLVDGITENIITVLSSEPRLFVAARNSTFTYKGKPVKVQQVAEALGVRYVLEGSVLKSGDRVRVTAQLIDALKGHHLWAERYDRELKDIFALQDDVTIKILRGMQLKLTKGEGVLQLDFPKNLEVYLKVMQGIDYLRKFNIDDNNRARLIAEECIALEPDYGMSYGLLGSVHMMDYWLGSTKNPVKSLNQAIEYTQKALDLSQFKGRKLALLGYLYAMKRDYDKAIELGEQAIPLVPNGADAHAWLAMSLNNAGRPEEALPFFKKAMRLNPFSPAFYYQNCGSAYRNMGRFEEAVAMYKKTIQLRPNNAPAHAWLAATYALMGREQEARTEATEVLRINPKFSVAYVAKILPFKRQSDKDQLIDGLRKAGLPETPPLPLPDKPSIAVLPFTNMSGDPEQEYFSDGITEEIITALSKTPKLFVIARNSSFTYKGKSVWVPTVGKELGVRYVLEGSVRREGDKVRVTAQLIDAKTNHHLWAERYDRDLQDLFAVQDEITKEIITELQIELTEGEQARVYERGTKNLEAYLKILQAAAVGRRLNQEDNLKARRMAEEAIALDPNYASAYRELGATHMREVWLRIAKSPRESLRRAAELAKKALALDQSLPPAHTVLGQVYLLSKNFDKAIAEGQQVVELDPNGAESHWFLGMALVFAGRPEEAIQSLDKAMRLNPFAPSHYFHMLALSYWYLRRYEDAIEWGRKAVKRTPEDQLSHSVLTMSYSSAGHEEQARSQAAKLLKINPKYCVRRKGGDRFKDPEGNERFKNALRKAGVPDCPPGPSSK
jgi:adenylate cyclase